MKIGGDDVKVLFPRPLTKAVFLERPNRFVIHCRLTDSEEQVVAHLADPGRLKELLVPGSILWLLENDNPKRKTKWSAVLCENEDKTGLVSINTSYPNKLIEKAIQAGILEEFAGWSFRRAEFKLGDSRWDFLLENKEGKSLLLEVKSVTLAYSERGMFPDAVTARGTKHVKELTKYAGDSQYETAILFVVQREDIEVVTPAAHIDGAFAEALEEAERKGVRLLARTCRISLDGIALGDPIPVNTTPLLP